MSLGTQSAGLLFKIDADTSNFDGKMRGIDGTIGKAAGAMAGLASAAPIAGAALLAMGAAVVTVATNLYQLTVASAEFAGKIFDVGEKTGLSAATLSTLKVNADLAGSSLESVGNGAAKFSKLLGEAAAGNQTAQKTLAELNVTSYDLETALAQATKTIYEADAGTEKLNLSMKAFGRSGGDLIGTINQMGGDLKGATKEAEKLGLVMSEKDLAAADAFGDSLALLSNQAKVAGVAFTSELMPVLAKYFGMASKWIGENRDLIRTWGTYVASLVANLARGISVSFNFILDNANALRAGLAVVTLGISELAIQAAKLIAMYYKVKGLRPDTSGAEEGMGGSGVSVASILPSGGGRDGGGGGSKSTTDPAAEAEKARKAEVDAAKKAVADTLEIYRKGYEERQAALELKLTQGAITETEKVRDTARIRREALMDEIRLTKSLLTNDKLNTEERAELTQKLKILAIDLRTETLKGSKEITEQVKKEIAEQEKLLKIEQERLRTLQRRIAADQQKERQQRLDDQKEQAEGSTLRTGGFAGGIIGAISMMTDATLTARDKMAGALFSIEASWSSFAESIKEGIDTMIAGIGNMISNFILMGSTGPSQMRKLTAGIIAGLAAQAAILSVFELAKGFAALFFNPAEAAAHFQAAALFGSIAIGAGIVGRKLAGNLFANESGGGGGSGGGDEDQGNRPIRITERFQGFLTDQQKRSDEVLAKVMERTNAVLGGVKEELNAFRETFGVASPGDVVMAGAGAASSAIFDANLSEIRGDGGKATELKRGMGGFY